MKFLAILLLAALTAEVVVAAPGKLSRSKRHDDPTEHDEWASSGWGSDYSDDDYYEGSGASPWDGDDEAEGFEEKDEGTTPEKVEAGQVSGSGDLFFNASQEVPDMMAFNASGMPGSMAFNVSQVMAGLMPFNMSQGMPDMMPFNLSQGFPGMIPGQMPFNLSQGIPDIEPTAQDPDDSVCLQLPSRLVFLTVSECPAGRSPTCPS
ncbi:uncharacterized protein LOC119594834 [Penaeus monodon]|uniref:uncharacterized protein LOC119594834 n=1 Tax=Penaeus monodon TaxID=6687 RepID=UPI0018A725D9|nr:uncharacterized protein LOC119594834 [Penaeus monodon]